MQPDIQSLEQDEIFIIIYYQDTWACNTNITFSPLYMVPIAKSSQPDCLAETRFSSLGKGSLYSPRQEFKSLSHLSIPRIYDKIAL